MTAFYRDGERLQELKAGEWLVINGERRRVMSVTIKEADADDPELGVKVGDLVTTLELVPDGGPGNESRA